MAAPWVGRLNRARRLVSDSLGYLQESGPQRAEAAVKLFAQTANPLRGRASSEWRLCMQHAHVVLMFMWHATATPRDRHVTAT